MTKNQWDIDNINESRQPLQTMTFNELTVDCVMELVHEIERLQTENIEFAHELKWCKINNSLPHRTPYPHDSFSMGAT